jgi:Bacterial Ig-like domain (group 3)/Concanavalin A-like lectin/glucanases superfamily
MRSAWPVLESGGLGNAEKNAAVKGADDSQFGCSYRSTERFLRVKSRFFFGSCMTIQTSAYLLCRSRCVPAYSHSMNTRAAHAESPAIAAMCRSHSLCRLQSPIHKKRLRGALAVCLTQFLILMALFSAGQAVAQKGLIAFATPQQGYAAVNGQFIVTLNLYAGAQPSTLHVISGTTDVTPLFPISACTQAPCTLSATLTTANGIVAGQNFITASILGTGGAAQTAHMQFNGSGFSDPTNGSAPGYIVSVQQTITSSSSTVTIGTPTPTVVTSCSTGSIRLAVLNRSSLAVRSSDCYVPANVASTLSGLDESDIIIALSAPGDNTGAADFTGLGGSSASAGPFTTYSAIGYGQAGPFIGHEAWLDPHQAGSTLATVRGNLVNLGCNTLRGIDSNGNSVGPTTTVACAENNGTSLYSFMATDNIGFAILPGAHGSAGNPGLPTIYVGNPSNIPIGDGTVPNNQIRPTNSSTAGDLFSYRTFTPTWTDASAEGGVYLVVLNSIDLSVISQNLYVTNCGSCTDHSSENTALANIAAALTSTKSNYPAGTTAPNRIYIFTTVGVPFDTASDTAPLLSAVSGLGVSPYALQGVIPDDIGTPAGTGFSFVSYALQPGSYGTPTGTSASAPAVGIPGPIARLWSSSANTQQGETGALRGVFVKGAGSYYQPSDLNPFDPSTLPVYATGDDYLTPATTYALGSTEPVAWPFMDTPGGQNAYSYVSTYLIDKNLFPGTNGQCQAECNDIRFWYTGDQAANLYSTLGPAGVPYPGDSTASANGFTQTDFDNVQQQLELEQVYLGEILALRSFAEQINTDTSQNIALALTQAGTNIALDLQNQLGFSQKQTGDSPVLIIGDTLNILAGFLATVIPALPELADLPLLTKVKSTYLPVLDGLLWMGSAAFTAGADGETNKTVHTPDPYVTQLQQLISTESNAATAAATNFNANLESGTGIFYDQLLSDWFRMQSAALMSVNQGYGGWYVADTDQGNILNAQYAGLVAAQRVQLWQQIVPQYFARAQYNGIASGWLVAGESETSTLFEAARIFSFWYPPNAYGDTDPNPDGIDLEKSTPYSWDMRTSAAGPACQDYTYIFVKQKWNTYWTPDIGNVLMGPGPNADGTGNLNIDRNWFYDNWNIPWYDAAHDLANTWQFPVTVNDHYVFVRDVDDTIRWNCAAHPEPYSGQPATVIGDPKVSPSATIAQGTPSVTVSGKISTVGSTKIPPGSISITIGSVAQTANISSSDGTFTSTFATQSLPGSPTPYVIYLSYAGVQTFAPSINSNATLTVLSPSSDVELSADVNPSYYGQAVNLTAKVKSPSGTPTGSVTFYDSSVSLGTVKLDANGSAQLSLSKTYAGTHLMTATYGGASGIDGNNSNLLYVQVNLLTTSLVPIPLIDIPFGSATATVSGQILGMAGSTVVSSPPAGETVTVRINNVIQTTMLTANGNFSLDFPLTGFSAGTYPVQIEYPGDNNFTPLADQSTTLLLYKIIATFGSLTPSQSILAGTPSITLSGSIVPVGGITPTGNVIVTINGVASPPVPLINGSFTLGFSTATLPANATPYIIDYRYSGDANYATNGDNSTSVTVSQNLIAPSFRKLTASQGIYYGQPNVTMSGIISTAPQSTGVLTGVPSDGVTLNLGYSVFPITPTELADTTHSTFSFWINTTEKSQQTILRCQAGLDPDLYDNIVSVYMQGDQIGVHWDDATYPSDDWLSTNTASISDGQWHHIDIVFGTSAANGLWYGTLYKDGVSTGETFGVHHYDFGGPLILGEADYLNSIPGFTGQLWNVKVWNQAFSSSSLAADLYRVYVSPAPSGLLVQSFFDPSNNTVSNIVNGQNTGAPGTTVATEDVPVNSPAAGEQVTVNIGSETEQTTIGWLGNFSLDFPTATIPPGNYAINYKYSGDAIFSAVTDLSTTLLVQAVPTKTALVSSPSSTTSILYGTPLIFTATVSADNVVPAGTVTFYNGTTAIGPVELLSSGVASFATSSLAVGNYSIQAGYSGGTNYAASASTVIPVTITALTPAFTNLTSSTIGYGTSSLALGGYISAGGFIPSGSVTIGIGSTNVQASAPIKLDGTFSAALNTSSLAMGTYVVTYTYSGLGNFGFASDHSTQLIVGPASANIVLTSSEPLATYGSAVTFTATVASSIGSPTGTVTFMDGATALGSPVMLSAGTASLQISTLAAGLHSITAVYSGDATFAAGTSNVLSQFTVAPANTSTMLASSATTANYGAFITFTATISNPSTATGTVTFFDSGSPLGAPVAVVAGQAVWQTGSLSVGSHSITAVYTSDSSNYISSTSLVLTETIQALASVFSNITPSQTATANTSTISLGGIISTASSSGSVLQYLTATTAAGSGVALQNDVTGVSTNGATYGMWIKTSAKTQQILFQVANFHPIIAMTGDQLSVWWDYAGNLSVWTSTDTRPISDGNWHHIAVVFNQDVIRFYKDGVATADAFMMPSVGTADPYTNLGGSISNTAGFLGEMWNAKIWAGALSAADIAADMPQTYAGSIPANLRLLTSFDANANSATNLVNGQSTTIDSTSLASIASTTLPAYYPAPGEPISITIGSQTQTENVGVDGAFTSTFPLDNPSANIYPIQYRYQGNAYLAPGSDQSTTLTVTNSSSQTVLSSSAPTANYGTTVTFAAAVTSKAGSPTGTVTFMDGTAALGSPVTLSGGMASLPTSTLAAGLHSITAVYSGDANFATSTSSAISQSIVALTPLFITLTPSQTIPVGTASVTLGGQIAAGSYIPSGTVSIMVNGSTTPATIQSDGTFSATVDTHALGIDSYLVNYSFAASGNFASASDSTTRITIAASSTSTTLVSSATTADYGTFITFTATISNPSTATGTVSFFDGGNPLGSPVTVTAGKAVWQTGSLSAGPHSINAVYTSDSPNYIGSASSALPLTINSLVSVFSNLTPSQTANASTSTINLRGTISTAPSNGSVLQFLTASPTFGNGVPLQNDVTGISTDGATYSMWIKTTSKTNQMLFQVTNLHPIIAMTGDQLSVQWDYSGAVQTSTDTRPISDGNWHHIAVVFNQGVVTFYKDGVATSDSFTVPSGASSDPNTNLGGSLSNTSSFLGQMWNAKIWAGALTAADIAADLNQTYTSRAPAKLRLLTSFDANANTATNLVNGQSTTIDSASLASIATTILPAYYPAPGEPVSITIGSQSQTANVGVDGAFTTSFPLDSPAANIYPIQYSYQGNPYLAPGSDQSTTLTVTDSSTSTIVSSSTPTADYGVTVTFTATVTSKNGTPTGTVTFEDGGVAMGSSVTLSGGTAQFPIGTLSIGLHSITAVYTSDNTSTFDGSTSPAITQTISKLTPVFSNLTPSQTIAPGAALVLRGTIAAGSAIPSGGVVISLNNATAFASAPQPVPIGSDGKFSLSFDTSTLSADTYKVTYSYSGSDTYNGATDDKTTTITVVGLVTPDITMQASPNPVLQGNTVTLTATVQTTGSAVPTGNITFSETVDTNGLPLPNGPIYYGNADLVDGTSTLTVTATSNPTFSAGTHVLVATYGGDGGDHYNGNASKFYNLIVNASVGSSEPGFSLTIPNGGAATVAQGGSANFPMSLAPVSGYTGGVALTCTPADPVSSIGCSISPALVTLSSAPQTATVTITTVSGASSAVRKIAFLIGALALIPLAFRRRRTLASLFLLIAVAAFASAGCGGGSGNSDSQKLQYASPGTYNFTITASSTSGTSATSSVKVSVTVQ